MRDRTRRIANKLVFQHRIDADKERLGPRTVTRAHVYPCGIFTKDGKVAVMKAMGKPYVTLDTRVASFPECSELVNARGLLCAACTEWAEDAVAKFGVASLPTIDKAALGLSLALQPVLFAARRAVLDRVMDQRAVADDVEASSSYEESEKYGDERSLRRDEKHRRDRRRAPLPPSLPQFRMKSYALFLVSSILCLLFFLRRGRRILTTVSNYIIIWLPLFFSFPPQIRPLVREM